MSTRVEFGDVELSTPSFLADFRSRDHLMPFPGRLDVDAFRDYAGVKVKLTADAAADAVSIAFVALSGRIPKGTRLYFGQSKEFAMTTAEAAKGATSVAVQALPSALESGDIATYSPSEHLFVPAGTYVGRTAAEKAANAAFGPAAVGDDERYLLAYDVENVHRNGDCTFLRPGKTTVIKENYLPDWDDLNDEANAVYTFTINGTLSAGTFNFIDKNNNLSDAIAYNGNLAAIDAAAEGLWGTGDVVSAGTVPSFTLTFNSDLAGEDIGDIGIDGSNLTGFDGATVVRTTQGGSPLLELIRADYLCLTGEN